MKKVIVGLALAISVAASVSVFTKKQSSSPARRIFLCTWSHYFSDEILQEFTMRHTAAEVVDVCAAARVPAAIVGNGALLPEFEQPRARGTFVGARRAAAR